VCGADTHTCSLFKLHVSQAAFHRQVFWFTQLFTKVYCRCRSFLCGCKHCLIEVSWQQPFTNISYQLRMKKQFEFALEVSRWCWQTSFRKWDVKQIQTCDVALHIDQIASSIVALSSPECKFKSFFIVVWCQFGTFILFNQNTSKFQVGSASNLYQSVFWSAFHFSSGSIGFSDTFWSNRFHTAFSRRIITVCTLHTSDLSII